jgi:endonuclease-3
MAVIPARLPVIIKLLDQEYFRPRWAPRYEPVEELVYTILSQNTSDINSERALGQLKKRFPAWEQVAAAAPVDIARAIRPGGLADTKSRYIKETLSALLEEHGDLSLDFIKDMSDSEAIAYLTRFRGVGLKTASCVLLFAFGRPVMPVDTHVYRVARRLDFIGEGSSLEQAHKLMTAITPPEDIFSFHINLIAHGRRICKAGKPLCTVCVIEPLCPSSRAWEEMWPDGESPASS